MRASIYFTLANVHGQLLELISEESSPHRTHFEFEGMSFLHRGSRLDLSSGVETTIEFYGDDLPKWLRGKPVKIDYVDHIEGRIKNGFFRYKKCVAEVNTYMAGNANMPYLETAIKIKTEGMVIGGYDQAKRLYSLLRQGKFEELETIESWN
jgi:hypothetical protein